MHYAFPVMDNCSWCETADNSLLIIRRSEHGVALVPQWMRTPGACVVASARHVPTMFDLREPEFRDIFALAQQMARAVVSTLDPDGLHFWWDTGVMAGQTLDHFTIEVVPRYADQPYKFVPHDRLPIHSEHDVHTVVTSLKHADLESMPSGRPPLVMEG